MDARQTGQRLQAVKEAEAREEHCSQAVKEAEAREEHCSQWFCSASFSYTTQEDVLRGGSTHSELGSSTLHQSSVKKNSPTDL